MEGKKVITATDTQYSGSLLETLNYQRMQGLFCDVTVIVEDRKFRAHKNILSACSTYFHQLFCVAGQVVELNFVRADIFAEILNYIYSAKIVRVKCDMLEELIKSGKLLGVPFIAELGLTLSHVKSMTDGVKDGSADTQSDADGKLCEPKKNGGSSSRSSLANQGVDGGDMPIISEAFSLSGDKYKEKKNVSEDEDSDDDVIFCSEIVSAKQAALEKKEAAQSIASPSSDQSQDSKTPSSDQAQLIQNTKPVNQIIITPTGTPQKPAASGNTTSSPQPSSGSQSGTADPNQAPLNSSPTATTSASSTVPKPQQSVKILPKTEETLDGNGIVSPVSSATQKNMSFDGSGVQKKHVVTFTQESSSKPGEFKIKISDVVTGSNKDSHRESEPRHILDGKKIITLDTPPEIEGLSTGCKVYANIGEDTYDIVIPIKDDPEEGLSKLEDDDDDDGFPNRKRMKLKHDDHYELIVDGRVYYICIVCKRSYVCLTSLRRHFNVHSWEKKYPCRYCERVFPLAEYRTKHEIHHTGERRYQCLTCGSSFINYQVMASHIRSAHNLDPSRDPKIYRLNPCKTLQIRQYGCIGDPSQNSPVINDGGIVYDIDPDKPEPASEENNTNSSPKPVNWDDIFLQQSNENMFKPNASDGSTEFEFVIPESY
ncbi:transcriptional regulator Kaiso [Spea bombifrons]|uniref:transcriptional regulator Kaiso n=1 Tax=Spea bombifrons TaxID=233779 RepID=UPI00234B7974|nr:transcriptional regulator Kaiso [Spea bombifrons]